MAKQVKEDGPVDVLSPDGISIYFGQTYKNKKAAKAAFEEWVKRYKAQGYYSSARWGRIPVDEIHEYCQMIPA